MSSDALNKMLRARKIAVIAPLVVGALLLFRPYVFMSTPRHNLETNTTFCLRPPQAQPKRSKFYLVTIDELELELPAIRGCGYTIHGAMSYERWEFHPSRTFDKTVASLLVFPPFLVDELNWPVYGGGIWENNYARHGENPGSHGVPGDELKIGRCSREFEEFIRSKYSFEPHQKYLLHFGSSGFDRGYQLAPEAYSSQRAIVAKGEALLGRHRSGWDISLPPPFTDDPKRFRYIPTSTRLNRTLFLSFKGSLDTHTIRRRVKKELHNPIEGVQILSREDTSFEYWQLLSTTEFALVLRGHVSFSYRYSEVVCSGAIPVLISDEWVPPLEDLTPFLEYGVRIPEAQYVDTVRILKRIPWREELNCRILRGSFVCSTWPVHGTSLML